MAGRSVRPGALRHLRNKQRVYVRGHVIWLKFSDGAAGEIDLSGEFDGPVFEPLRNIENFKQFSIVLHTLAWPNGADFAPEFLRERVAVTV